MDNRQIDALVAEKVMGWGIHKRNTAFWVKSDRVDEVEARPIAFIHEWQPSTDISQAWQVVEKLRNNIYCQIEFWEDRNYSVNIITESGNSGYKEDKSISMAICLAALQAVGVNLDIVS